MVQGMIHLHAVMLGMCLLLLVRLFRDVLLPLLLLPMLLSGGILHGDLHVCTLHLSTGLNDCWLLVRATIAWYRAITPACHTGSV